MIGEFLDLRAWGQWFAALDREFIFILALPFVVALIGLWSWFAEREQEEHDASMPPSAEPAPRQRERRTRVRRRGDVKPAQQS